MAVSFELMVTLCSVKNWEKENNNNKIENKPFFGFFFFSFRMLKVPKNDAKKGTIMRKRMLNVKTPVSPHSTSSSLWILVLNTPKVTKKNIIIINS